MGHRLFHFFFASSPLFVLAAVYFLMLRLMDSWLLLPALFLVGLAFFGLRWAHKRVTGFQHDRVELGVYAIMLISGIFFYVAAHAEVYPLRYYDAFGVIESALVLAYAKAMTASVGLLAYMAPQIFPVWFAQTADKQ